MTGQESSPHDRDVIGEFAALVAAGAAEIDPLLARAALRALQAHLQRKFPTASPDDLIDLTQEAVTRLAEKAHSGAVFGIAAGGRPGGYLIRTAENLIIDRLRSARWARERPTPNEAMQDLVLTDDEAVLALDRRATTDLVRGVLREIEADRDVTLFLIATYMLDATQRTGRVPSNRETARAFGVSHTAVANALLRLRRYFAGER